MRRDQAARPLQQIPPDSYLGQTLRHIDRLGTKKRRTLRMGYDPSSPSFMPIKRLDSRQEVIQRSWNEIQVRLPYHLYLLFGPYDFPQADEFRPRAIPCSFMLGA